MGKNLKASRGWRFVIPLDPYNFDEVTQFGDYRPPEFPELLGVNFARGQAQFANVQPANDEEPRRIEFHGYVEGKNQLRHLPLQKWLPDAVFTPVDVKSRDQHIRDVTDPFKLVKGDLHCGLLWHKGEISVRGQGHRTDFDDIREILKSEGPQRGVKRVAEEFSAQFVRYHAGIQRLADIIEELPKDQAFKPNPFQQVMIEALQKPPHPRHIYWVYDKAGHSGKSRLAKYLQCEMDAVELQGREVDIAYGYTGQRIVIFDIPRATPLISYTEAFTCAERMKNGGLFSPKFQSKFKRFNTPHIVFFSNEAPIPGTWTEDRLQLITVEAPPPPAFHPFAMPLQQAPPPVYVPSPAELMAQRMKQLQEQAQASLTCHSCITRKTNGHTYSRGCHFNTEEVEAAVNQPLHQVQHRQNNQENQDDQDTEYEEDDRTTVTQTSDVET